MTNLRLYLTKLVSEAFELAGYDGALGVVTASNRPDLCQFQCNGAMSAAKIYKQKPISIAEAVTEKLSALCSMLSAFAVAPGFININVSDELLAERMNAMLTDERLLLPKTDESKTIVLDYGGPNVAKNLHVGHLRPAIIGDALYRIGKFLGYNVISDIHLGDWGLPMGLVIVALLERGINIRDLSLDELNAIYPDASARSKEDEEFAEEAQRVTRELQQGNEQYRKIWEEIREISIADAKSNYDALNVRDFDYWYGESTAQPYVADVIAMLTERGLLKDDDGAQIVAVKRDDDKEPIPPLIILKRGRAMYVTSDLATILQRERDFKPDEMWYFTDARQTLYFKQVFRCAAMGELSAAKCSFTGFGTVNGKDGKPYKTRSGGVMRLADMIDEVRGKLPDPKVACAAIRIADLQNQPTKDYQFDLDKFTAAEGKTGPYLQYTAVRIASVLSKAEVTPPLPPLLEGGQGGSIAIPASNSERALMLTLDGAGDALVKAFEDKAPNALCDTLFDIAAKFNTFYGEQRILSHSDEVQRGSWLALLTLTRGVLVTLLDLLGVEVPEVM